MHYCVVGSYDHGDRAIPCIIVSWDRTIAIDRAIPCIIVSRDRTITMIVRSHALLRRGIVRSRWSYDPMHYCVVGSYDHDDRTIPCVIAPWDRTTASTSNVQPAASTSNVQPARYCDCLTQLKQGTINFCQLPWALSAQPSLKLATGCRATTPLAEN